MTTEARLKHLAAAIDATLADPDDDAARRRAGRLCAIAALMLLPSDDDRRTLLVAVAQDAADAASSPSPASEIGPGRASTETPDASTGHAAGGRGVEK